MLYHFYGAISTNKSFSDNSGLNMNHCDKKGALPSVSPDCKNHSESFEIILFAIVVNMHSRDFELPALLFAALTHGYANPGACSGECVVYDPTIIQRSSDSKYFRFSTGNEISYVTASSIEGPWTAVGSVLPDGSSIDLAGNTDLWVRFHVCREDF